MLKIMVVDDNQDANDSLAKYLEAAGHQVISVRDGKEALAAVLASPPDVVLLDLLMPEMDGPTFLEVVRSYLRLHALPVVVLTGLAESPMVERAQFLKVNSVLVKGKAAPEEIKQALEAAAVRIPG